MFSNVIQVAAALNIPTSMSYILSGASALDSTAGLWLSVIGDGVVRAMRRRKAEAGEGTHDSVVASSPL